MKLEQLKGLYARLDASRSKEEADDVLKEFKALCESFTEDEKLEYRDEILKIACQRLDAAIEAV